MIEGLIANSGLKLNSVEVLKGIGNPETGFAVKDVLGLLAGGIAGWYIAKRWPGFVVRGVGVLAGMELGILLSRMISRKGVPNG